jgi:hypothetical protein
MRIGITDGEIFHEIGIVPKVRLMRPAGQVNGKLRVMGPLTVRIDAFPSAARYRQADQRYR